MGLLFVDWSGALYDIENASSVAYAQLSVNIAHVVLRSPLCDGQFLAKALYGAPSHEKFEDLSLAGGEAGRFSNEAAPLRHGGLVLGCGVACFSRIGAFIELLQIGLREDYHSRKYQGGKTHHNGGEYGFMVKQNV